MITQIKQTENSIGLDLSPPPSSLPENRKKPKKKSNQKASCPPPTLPLPPCLAPLSTPPLPPGTPHRTEPKKNHHIMRTTPTLGLELARQIGDGG